VQQGDLDAAVDEYTKAVQLQANYAEAYYARGYAHHNKGDLDAAIDDYTKAIQVNVSYAEAYYGRACSHLKKGRVTEAEADYARAVDLGFRPPKTGSLRDMDGKNRVAGIVASHHHRRQGPCVRGRFAIIDAEALCH